MKYYIIAGEASGDLHGSNLMAAIKREDPEADFRFWGGDLMAGQGGTEVKHYRDLAFMGFLEVISNLGTILSNLKFCKSDIIQWNPDVLILIDYPGFNLRIAEFAKKQGIKVIYYISPQIWAWKQSRVYRIREIVDLMLVILPFEKDFYNRFNYDVKFVGHPLLDEIAIRRKEYSNKKFIDSTDNRPVVALLPGSRKQEIRTMLPVMLETSRQFKDYRFIIAAAPGLSLDFYKEITGSGPVEIIQGETYNLLSVAHAALVTSGTATLETALFNVPQVVCYKGNYFSYLIARQLVKVKYISLVNLVMDKEVVTELIQSDFNKEKLQSELSDILQGEGRIKMLEEYKVLHDLLGGEGASAKAAHYIAEFMHS